MSIDVSFKLSSFKTSALQRYVSDGLSIWKPSEGYDNTSLAKPCESTIYYNGLGNLDRYNGLTTPTLSYEKTIYA
jgi:hypothetical protein